MQVIETISGRVINGIVISENENTLTVQTVNEKVAVPLDEIEQRAVSSVSMMPDGLAQQLSMTELVELISYLVNPE